MLDFLSLLKIEVSILWFLVNSTAEKNQGDVALERLRASILNLASVEATQLRNWLRHVILGASAKPATSAPTTPPVEPAASTSVVTLAVTEPLTPTNPSQPRQENQLLLQYLTLYIISENRSVLRYTKTFGKFFRKTFIIRINGMISPLPLTVTYTQSLNL